MGKRRTNTAKNNLPQDGGKPDPQTEQSGAPVAPTAQSNVASYPLPAKRSEKGLKDYKSVSAKASLGPDQQSSESGKDGMQPGGSDLSKAPSAPAEAPAAPDTSHMLKPTPGAAHSSAQPSSSTDQQHSTPSSTPSSATKGNTDALTPTDASIGTVIDVTRGVIDATTGGNSQAELEEAAAPGPDTGTSPVAAAATAAAIAASTSGSLVVTTAPLSGAAGGPVSAAAPDTQHNTTTDRQSNLALHKGGAPEHSSTPAEGGSKDTAGQQAGRDSPSDKAGGQTAGGVGQAVGRSPSAAITSNVDSVSDSAPAPLQPEAAAHQVPADTSQQLSHSTEQLSAGAPAVNSHHHPEASPTSSSSSSNKGPSSSTYTNSADQGPAAAEVDSSSKALAQQLHMPQPADVSEEGEAPKLVPEATHAPAAPTASMDSSSGGLKAPSAPLTTAATGPSGEEATGSEGAQAGSQLTAAPGSTPPQQGATLNSVQPEAVQHTHAPGAEALLDKVPVSYSSSSTGSRGPPRLSPFAAPTVPPYDAEVTEEAGATIAAIAAAASSIKPFPPQLLPAVGTSPGLTARHMEVLSVWYTKFCFDTEAQQQAALQQHCVQDMQFEDNFIKVAGRSKVGVQFYALKRLLRGIDLAPEKIELLPVKPFSPTYKLRIISRIAFQFYNYKWFPLMTLVFPALLLLPAVIDTWATDELTVRKEDNHIISYKQRVHNIPTAPAAARWLLGHATSWLLMYTLGW